MLKYAPTNEQEVVYLFALICTSLGYIARRVQTEFPDCILIDSMGKHVRCEFELRTSNFIQHRHPMDKCDLVVAWEDDCVLSSQISVIQLRKYFPDLDPDPDIEVDDLALNKTRIALNMIASGEATTARLSELFDKYHPKERQREPERLVARLIANHGEPFLEGECLRLGKPVDPAQILWSVAGHSEELELARKLLKDLGLGEYCSR